MKEPNLSTFGEYLACAIKDAGLSRAKVAAACGVDRSYITLLCAGKREPSISTLIALEAAMEFDFDVVDAVTVMVAVPSAREGR